MLSFYYNCVPSFCIEMTESWKISEKTREPKVLPGTRVLGTSYREILADFKKRLRVPSSTAWLLRCTTTKATFYKLHKHNKRKHKEKQIWKKETQQFKYPKMLQKGIKFTCHLGHKLLLWTQCQIYKIIVKLTNKHSLA